jgi:hypothetical protein
MNPETLTNTQIFVLSAAAKRADGRVEHFPPTVQGGARLQVLAALHKRGLIRIAGAHPVLTEAGLNAIRPLSSLPRRCEAEDALEVAVADAEASWMADAHMSTADTPIAARPARRRACTKQALLIEMLNRPNGASIAQLTEALGWQPHSVRGALVTVIRKFGLTLHTEKVAGARRYRVQTEATTHASCG